MKKVAIVAAQRSAIGSFGGSLKDTNIAKFGADLLRLTLEKIKLDPKEVNEVIFGNVLQAGLGQNIARQIAVHAGLPKETPAFVVNKVCGSGLKSVNLAANSILVGENDVVVCGGIEFMSQAPYLSKSNRFGSKLGNAEMIDSIIHDGLTDAFEGYHMGITAENIARKYSISRSEADDFAAASQQKAEAAIKAAKFKDEIIPLEVKVGRETKIFDTDEFPRFGTSAESLAKLRPAFDKEGVSTAGNSSGINDGAAILVLMSEDKAKELEIPILAFIEGKSSCGLDHKLMGLGPVTASKKLLNTSKIDIKDIDLFELNEAFASQSIAVLKDLEIDSAKVNVNGGAIALGHPIGASGARILVTLIHELKKQDKNLGLASLCIGGGQGISILISNNR
ncbi:MULTISPECIES: acetyl-CoA C-acetyltransferase [unclassified Gemella]|uniref:acetyl-CoA C-acetyltransferase n=1 Tax=unclassified Gemella TaxID=2624949 RepID=UPI00107301FB|nr:MULTISPECIES: acetyl-CoA C-acetyltransferase [unclassified Gemella]MBF0710537.1 acetyl-CoA C-acetyltransferase [Gemella sp. GL1.1]MBF0747214.1 acetyl-CoA C-acetyltransferase [Gemella sp. 19428wG2_WT2a]NYS27881.1 acetyl-CoA C-acetyltransferase [Gemella sp. GL1]TFU58009.1 acetyl-CoA C-acetyltransferase [Gemella sp. WT2a]